MPSPAPRIAYVVKRYPRFSETFIVNEILTHEAAGHAVEIISLYPPNDTHFQDAIARVRAPVTYLSTDGVKAAELWNELERAADVFPGLWSELASARGAEVREVYQAVRLARLVRERGLGLLHAHFASTATEVARLAARFARIPFTFTAHAKDIFHESADADDLRRKLAEAAQVITVSDFNVAFLRRQFGGAARRVSRLYNGIDLDRFPFSSPRGRRPRIVAVGRLIEKKGFAVLVNACELLAQRNVAFVCDIIGAGELEAALRAQIQRLGLADRVRLPGPRPQQEIVTLLRDAAALAAPCVVGADGNADGLPTVLLEAMAIGTPCISTDVTGIPEVLRDGETGLQVKQHDPAGLATALERLLVDAELRVPLAGRARELIQREFDVRRNAARQWDWFVEAMDRSAALTPLPGSRANSSPDLTGDPAVSTLKRRERAPVVCARPTLRGQTMNAPRIAYICADPGVPVFGRKGCSIHVQEVVRALRRHGAHVQLFAARYGGAPPGDLRDLIVHALPCPDGRNLAERERACQHANKTLARMLRAASPFDFVYERYSLWSFSGMRYAVAHNIPGLLEVNAPLIEEQAAHRGLVDRTAAERIAERVFRQASAFVAVSEEVAAYLRAMRASPRAIHVLPNGVDPSRFPAERAPAWRRPEDEPAFTVGFVGTLKSWHGLPVLIESFAGFQSRAPEARLLVVGDGPEREPLAAQVRKLGLDAVCHFTGAVEPEKIPGLLAAMDVAVAPYPPLDNFYFSPLKVYEYMAAGRAVLASGIGQLERLIRHGENGLLCEPGDPEDLAAQLARLHGDAALRARLGAAARQTILSGHTWRHVAGRILALAESCRNTRSRIGELTPAISQDAPGWRSSAQIP